MNKSILSKPLITILLSIVFISCVAKEPDKTEVATEQIELPSLQAKLDEKKAQFEQRASEEIKNKFAEGGRAVAMSGVLETALKVGDTAPDFTLPNANGQPVRLYGLLQNKAVILSWYRGGW